jgi:hypothetical protein
MTILYSIRFLTLGNHIMTNFLGKRLPLRQSPPKGLDKSFVPLTALGLCGRLRCVWQRTSNF